MSYTRPLRQLRLLGAGTIVVALAVSPDATASAQQETRYLNLKVLSADISEEELGEVMLDNLRGLGLRRRAGEGCLYCHVGSLQVPRDQWDYASDERPAKKKARVMMDMVRQINDGFLPRLGDRFDPKVQVTCYTCHAGRTDPSPLPDLLTRRYREGGITALVESYREVRDRYDDADAYDFRVGTLMTVASRLDAMGQPDDARRLHQLNIEVNDGLGARAGLIRHLMGQALSSGGIDSAVAAYRRLKTEQPGEAFTPLLLDRLAWGLFRGGDQASGLRLFELNFEEHPTDFVSYESLAWAYQLSGDSERALALAERWLGAHRDHESGRRLVDELRRDDGQ